MCARVCVCVCACVVSVFERKTERQKDRKIIRVGNLIVNMIEQRSVKSNLRPNDIAILCRNFRMAGASVGVMVLTVTTAGAGGCCACTTRIKPGNNTATTISSANCMTDTAHFISDISTWPPQQPFPAGPLLLGRRTGTAGSSFFFFFFFLLMIGNFHWRLITRQ